MGHFFSTRFLVSSFPVTTLVFLAAVVDWMALAALLGSYTPAHHTQRLVFSRRRNHSNVFGWIIRGCVSAVELVQAGQLWPEHCKVNRAVGRATGWVSAGKQKESSMKGVRLFLSRRVRLHQEDQLTTAVWARQPVCGWNGIQRQPCRLATNFTGKITAFQQPGITIIIDKSQIYSLLCFCRHAVSCTGYLPLLQATKSDFPLIVIDYAHDSSGTPFEARKM